MSNFKSNRIELNVKYWLAQLIALLVTWDYYFISRTENKANDYQTNVRLLLLSRKWISCPPFLLLLDQDMYFHPFPPRRTETRGKQKPSSWSPFSPHPRHHGQCSRRRPTPATTAGDFLRRPASIQVFFFFFFSLIDAAFSHFCWWWVSLNYCSWWLYTVDLKELFFLNEFVVLDF